MRPALITADIGAASLIAASMMQWLPPVAALLGVLWYAVQLWESKTVQKWRRLRRHRQRMRRLALARVDVRLAEEETARPLDEPGAAP